MGREVRRVHKDWKHPTDEHGNFVPLYGPEDGDALQREWDGEKKLWDLGAHEAIEEDPDRARMSYEEWHGPRPAWSDYMRNWHESLRTHLQMYETTTEGTPISPVMATPEDLARWLTDNRASAFAGLTASYEAWLRVCQGGYACSAVASGGVLISGVEALHLEH